MNDLLEYVSIRGQIQATKSDIGNQIIPVLNAEDTVMYIANYDNGWELLSADVRMPKVLAMCDSGHLSSIELLYSNPAQREYLESLSNKIISLNDVDEDIVMADDNWSVITPFSESPDTWTGWYLTGVQLYRTDTMHEQDHLMRTKWDQSYPWDTKTPYTNSNKTSHCYTGCTIVAACQVLYYLQDFFNVSIPIYGSCSCSAFIPDGMGYVMLDDDNVTFDTATLSDSYWDLMPLTYGNGNHSYAATLMTYMGYLLGAKYKSAGTTATTFKIYDVYRNMFGFDCVKTYFNNIDVNYLKEHIVDDKLPCILEMWNPSGSGHVVVLDGFRQIRRAYIHHYQRHNNLAQRQYRDVTVTEYSNYVAINWGWGGTNDVDDDNGATIWYNLGSSWDSYNDFQEVVSEFRPLN